jgi:hypothetical protein
MFAHKRKLDQEHPSYMNHLALILAPIRTVIDWLNDLDEGAAGDIIMWLTMLYGLIRVEKRNAELLSELRKLKSADNK